MCIITASIDLQILRIFREESVGLHSIVVQKHKERKKETESWKKMKKLTEEEETKRERNIKLLFFF